MEAKAKVFKKEKRDARNVWNKLNRLKLSRAQLRKAKQEKKMALAV